MKLKLMSKYFFLSSLLILNTACNSDDTNSDNMDTNINTDTNIDTNADTNTSTDTSTETNTETGTENGTETSTETSTLPVLVDEISTLTERVTPDFAETTSSRLEAADKDINLLAEEYLASQQDDGSWPDIDYSLIPTQGAIIRAHLERIEILSSVAFLNNDVNAAQGAISAMYYWYAEDRTNSNWWWNEIGKQFKLGPAAFLLGDQLPSDLKELVAADMPLKPSRTGANRSDISKAVIYGGLLNKDQGQVERGLDGIQETIFITEDEGIQSDYSFQQHGPQLYMDGYGTVFFNTISYWAYLVRDLQWKFDEDKVDILANYFLDGVRWVNSHGQLDYNTTGRGISRDVNFNPSELIKQTDYVAQLAPDRAQEALEFKAHLSEDASSGFKGFKNFWRSDYATKVGSNHFIGIKMNSNRMKPTEAGNGENLLGYWLGFGSTFIMQRGDEYNGIFPVWNWGLVPGVTSPELPAKPVNWGRIEMSTTFTGGVSNGEYGVAVMDMDVYSTQAKKAWFSFNHELVALGAGITSTREENINTTVNQTLLNGPVTVNGQTYTEKGSYHLLGTSWVHHDGVGYVFPEFLDVQMDNETKHGSWSLINNTESDEPVEKDVFLLTMGHGVAPSNASYEYIIVPNKTANKIEQYARSNPIVVLSNTESLQAVTNTALNITGIVFHQAGSLVLNSGKEITVNKPSVLLVDESNAMPEIIISTPGEGTSVNTILSEGDEIQATTVTTSSDERWLGKGVKVDFSAPLLPTEPELEPETFTITSDAFVRDGGFADQNYGKNSYLVVKNDVEGGSDRKTVLKFELNNIDITDSSTAVLRIHVNALSSDSSRTITASRLSNINWDENTITWNTLPSVEKVGESPITITSAQAFSWIEIDVSDLIKIGTISLVLENRGKESGNSNVNFASREGGKGAELIVTP